MKKAPYKQAQEYLIYLSINGIGFNKWTTFQTQYPRLRLMKPDQFLAKILAMTGLMDNQATAYTTEQRYEIYKGIKDIKRQYNKIIKADQALVYKQQLEIFNDLQRIAGEDEV